MRRGSLLALLSVLLLGGLALAVLFRATAPIRQRVAIESSLRAELAALRAAIAEHVRVAGCYPSSLQELVAAGHLREIPVDPVSGSAETWQPVLAPRGEGADSEACPESGWVDVVSGAPGAGADGVPYRDW